jgi:hypothetical protein
MQVGGALFSPLIFLERLYLPCEFDLSVVFVVKAWNISGMFAMIVSFPMIPLLTLSVPTGSL